MKFDLYGGSGASLGVGLLSGYESAALARDTQTRADAVYYMNFRNKETMDIVFAFLVAGYNRAFTWTAYSRHVTARHGMMEHNMSEEK